MHASCSSEDHLKKDYIESVKAVNGRFFFIFEKAFIGFHHIMLCYYKRFFYIWKGFYGIPSHHVMPLQFHLWSSVVINWVKWRGSKLWWSGGQVGCFVMGFTVSVGATLASSGPCGGRCLVTNLMSTVSPSLSLPPCRMKARPKLRRKRRRRPVMLR